MSQSSIWLLGTTCLVSAVAAAAAVGRPNGPHLLCQLIAGVVNCSAGGSDSGGDRADFYQLRSDELQVQVGLRLPAGQRDFSVASLAGLASRFPSPGDLSLELLPGPGSCRLLPGCLDSLVAISRLTLRLRLADSRVPDGVFTARLARLRNLQLETPQVAEVAAGAFSELHSLERLNLANLQLHRLDGSLLRGLSALRILELPDNRFTRLDAASFAASPRLETINLQSGTQELTVAADTFCGLSSLQQLQISAAAGLNCSLFASRRLHLRLSSRAEPRTVRCVRMLGQSTVCTGSAGVRWTFSTMKWTSTKMTTIYMASTTIADSVATATAASRVASTKQIKTTAMTMTTPTISTNSPTSTGASGQTSSTSTSKADRRSDKQATPSASGVSAAAAGPIIAGVVVAAALLLAAVSVGIFLSTRQGRFGGVGGGRLTRSRSQQPIFSPGGSGEVEVDMQDVVWNPTFQGGGVSAAAAADRTTDGED